MGSCFFFYSVSIYGKKCRLSTFSWPKLNLDKAFTWKIGFSFSYILLNSNSHIRIAYLKILIDGNSFLGSDMNSNALCFVFIKNFFPNERFCILFVFLNIVSASFFKYLITLFQLPLTSMIGILLNDLQVIWFLLRQCHSDQWLAPLLSWDQRCLSIFHFIYLVFFSVSVFFHCFKGDSLCLCPLKLEVLFV